MTKVAIQKSSISGEGLFALEAFKKGDIILDWKDTVDILSESEFNDLPESEKKFISFIDGKILQFKGFGRKINHSCEPNAIGQDGYDIALRDIAVGEEITVNYFDENVPNMQFTCHCQRCKLPSVL